MFVLSFKHKVNLTGSVGHFLSSPVGVRNFMNCINYQRVTCILRLRNFFDD